MNDTHRAIAVPRRPVPPPSQVVDLSALFVRPGRGASLRSVQSWALAEIANVGGLVAPIGVGEGKTLIDLLAARAYGVYLGRDDVKTLLLVPASLRDQLRSDRDRYDNDFRLPSGVVWSYAHLSRPESAHELERLAPDLIIADEAHNLRNPEATRTRRVARYFDEHPETGFVALSGTLTAKSLFDYAHLCEWALGEGSPLPQQWTWLRSWAACIDADGIPGPQDLGSVRGLIKEFGGSTDGPSHQAKARAAFARRFAETPGVVTTPDSDLGVSLVIADRKIKTPQIVHDTIAEVEETWQVPGGDCFDSPAQLASVLRQIGQGFYYRWVWPDGAPDVEWLVARAAWHKAVRNELKRGRPGLDSPALIARAVDASLDRVGPRDNGTATFDARRAWLAQARKPAPPVETVWLSDYLIDDAVAWANKRPGRVVWYAHTAVGERLAAKGLRVFGPGTDPTDSPVSCAASIAAHGTGKNMQGWCEGLVMSPPSSGATWEQLLGRLHRHGQQADEVRFEVYRHLETYRAAFGKAVVSARYIEQTQGARMRLCYAPILG